MITLLLVLGLLLQATVPPATAGVELDPSDPQGINGQEIAACLGWTGRCNIRYLSGRFHIRHTIHIPYGVVRVDPGVAGTTLIPCPLDGDTVMYSIFFVQYPPVPPGNDQILYPQIVIGVDQTQACGEFHPPPSLNYINSAP
jgi:hypothetical protein